MKLRRHILKSNLILYLLSHTRSIHSSIPICLVSSCFTRSQAIPTANVLLDKRGVDVVTGSPKSSSNYRNQVTSVTRAIACNLASVLKPEIAICFFVFLAMKNSPRKDTLSRKWSEIRMIASPRIIWICLMLQCTRAWKEKMASGSSTKICRTWRKWPRSQNANWIGDAR